MVDSVSVSTPFNEENKLKESLSIGDYSVPTDLTVSVSAPSQDHEISEISSIVESEKRSQQEKHHQDIVKRLRSELQLTKLSVSKKIVETEKILADKKQEIELLKQHAHLYSRENENLKKENNSLSQNIVDLQTKNLRHILEETSGKTKETVTGLEKRLTELTVKHQRVLKYIESGEFTFEEFNRLKASENSLIFKCETLGRENASFRKTAEKWKNKFTKLRHQYENRLQDEVAKLRQSLQKQIQMLRSSGAETLNSKMLENEQRRVTAEKEANYWRNLCEKLKSKVRGLEVNEEKKRLQLEEMETKKNELVQRLSFIASSKSKLEKELSETKQTSQASLENLKQDIAEHERRAQQYQLRIENQTKSLNEYEEAFLAVYGIVGVQGKNDIASSRTGSRDCWTFSGQRHSAARITLTNKPQGFTVVRVRTSGRALEENEKSTCDW
ncbi:hypothetical protein DAPPUDRAFT_104583 [Daphnia pulex]|uniref:Uncharacterized protein n=1 Tax=Daphnia pulex TaxID=6669 RepID=E9GMP3_DAPPU|nr:hypothetical protein DAPPUDRAFT_104583 [Daphnia pulex]|eukprot:EFX79131.1 hypothetical protein DAPPUDRAFT_104583 [Daphnia pulex]